MTKTILTTGAVLALLLASGGAWADDPTGVLEQEHSIHHSWHHHHHGMHEGRAAFSDVGPCTRGMQSEAFPNGQGFRCVPR
ncbi:MAG: hypothetical protein ABR970_07505 [Roseiarcus sp.]